MFTGGSVSPICLELGQPRSVKLKKTKFAKIVMLLALSATPNVYARELSMIPHPIAITISFTNATTVTDMGFTSASDLSCGPEVTASYSGGTPFSLGATSPRVAYFNGHLPAIADQLCLIQIGGTIGLDGIVTDQGPCSGYSGCYLYRCDAVGGSITDITPLDPAQPFAATCP